MSVEITLFGFGNDCPPGFNNNKLSLVLPNPQGIIELLQSAGFDNLEGVVLLVNNKGVPEQDWPETQIQDNDSVKLLSAIEGG